MTAAPVPPAKLPFPVALLLAMVAGYSILMFLPHMTPPEPVPAPGTWFEAVQAAVRTVWRVPMGVLLFLCGLGLGWAQPRYWFLLALSTLAVLPVASIADLLASKRAPTIWMLAEFVMFFCMALPALAGAAIARTARYKGVPEADSRVF